jgi:dipeptidase E
MEALLLSNSTNFGGQYLAHAREAIAHHLGSVRQVLFVPFALADHDAYTAQARDFFEPLGIGVVGAHEVSDPVAAATAAEGIFVGGGNTFRLVDRLQRNGMLTPIRDAVRAGCRYLGASAGTNIASPSLRTTNDMPIVEPKSFQTLGLVPFQLNPHYLDPDPHLAHNGETRAMRLGQFLEENDVPVLALREGTWLHVGENSGAPFARIGGRSASALSSLPAMLFQRGQDPEEVSGDVTALLNTQPEYDR